MDMEELAKLKLGTVAKEAIFMKTITNNFTSYFEPLIPWVNRLRKIVFPRDRRQEQALPSNERNSPGGMRGLDLIDKRDGRDTESAYQEPAIMTR